MNSSKTGRMRSAVTVVAAVLMSVSSVVGSGTAAAAPDCAAVGGRSAVVAKIPGSALEGLAVDASGRAYVTDIVSGRVYRIDAPGQPAYPIAKVPSGGGGALAWMPDGTLLVGYGADPRVFVGDLVKAAGIVRLDVESLVVTPFATGLSAANGLAVAADGTVYATNDFGSLIGRIGPDGSVDPAWARFPSANGAVLDAAGQYLYVSRTFVNPGVSRIPIANPSAPQSLLNLSGLDSFAAPDGLTLDDAGRPVIPLNAGGSVVRIDSPGSTCVIGTGTRLTSVVVYGRSEQGFSSGRLFGAGFDGVVREIPGPTA
ncbi:NHL repeat containing protein [Rhodococcus sp. AW25M09]|uniref:SMP-30/gluconolactonase/LRE family protein n=1 Tax=Rhodococcus sp. AW25M09 TaxID=1268303 RepID=UPI0002ABE3F6|nr:NHL repeat containing protein [Rhodococcus sp. AW25M09]CCQ15422.1 NHL repeat containing protein [Rhodococcus sp. AW25M09]